MLVIDSLYKCLSFLSYKAENIALLVINAWPIIACWEFTRLQSGKNKMQCRKCKADNSRQVYTCLISWVGPLALWWWAIVRSFFGDLLISNFINTVVSTWILSNSNTCSHSQNDMPYQCLPRREILLKLAPNHVENGNQLIGPSPISKEFLLKLPLWSRYSLWWLASPMHRVDCENFQQPFVRPKRI